jgi:hypothetical protein
VPREGGGTASLPEFCVALYKKREYSRAAKWRWDSPYRHWEGWGSSTGVGESFTGSQEGREGSTGERGSSAGASEAWEGPREGRESSAGLQEDWDGDGDTVREKSWEGVTEESEGWDGPRESSMGRSEA